MTAYPSYSIANLGCNSFLVPFWLTTDCFVELQIVELCDGPSTHQVSPSCSQDCQPSSQYSKVLIVMRQNTITAAPSVQFKFWAFIEIEITVIANEGLAPAGSMGFSRKLYRQ